MKIYKKVNYEAIATSHINKYEQISHAAPLFLLLTLNRVFFFFEEFDFSEFYPSKLLGILYEYYFDVGIFDCMSFGTGLLTFLIQN